MRSASRWREGAMNAPFLKAKRIRPVVDCAVAARMESQVAGLCLGYDVVKQPADNGGAPIRGD